jgi:septal ring factor EnvC (AmiA/AmiB activator)
MAAPVAAAAARALPTVVRVVAKPKVFARFLKTKAGKKVTLKWGRMLLQSKTTQKAVEKLLNKNNKTSKKNKKQTDLEKEYKELQKKVAKMEQKLDSVKNDNDALEAQTFKLGRQVVQMRRLYQEMLQEYQMQQQQLVASARGHTR